MSKKQTLTEGEVRKFMKFADLGTLSDNFVEKLQEYGMSDEVEEGLYEEDELPVDDAMAEPDVDLPVGDDDVDVEPEEPGDEATDLAMKVAQAVADAVTDATGVEVTASEAPDDGLEGAPEDLAPDELGAEDEDDLTALGPEGAPDDVGDELDEADIFMEDDALEEEDLVNEVARRVAKRLLTSRRRR